MQAQHADPNSWVSYVIPAIVIAIVFALRLRRVSRARPLRLDRLWVVPAVYALVVAASFAAQPPSASGWAVSVVALIIGAALGWQRGKTIGIHVDPATGELNQKASIGGLAFLFVVIVAKQLARAGGTAMHLDVAALTDAMLALALGTFALMRVEMYLRAKRVIASSHTPDAQSVL